jgi:NADH:ubiquinone oxidoreductase subunit E
MVYHSYLLKAVATSISPTYSLSQGRDLLVITGFTILGSVSIMLFGRRDRLIIVAPLKLHRTSQMEPDVKEQLDNILSQYDGESADLIPILQAAQGRFGYLPKEVMREVAKFLRLPESTVYGVSTFYAQFKLIPTGKRIVRVCRGTACYVRGGARILREVERWLGIKSGETTDDLEYSLETVACFGSCALSPVIVINTTVYGRMTPAKVGQILDDTK